MKLSRRALKRIKKLRIGVVYLFGSCARGNKNFQSDFDTGIVFTDVHQLTKIDKIHPLLYDILTEEFPVTFKKDVDIVYLQQTSLRLQYQAINEGKVLFETDPLFRADYEEKVVREHLDFIPVERMFSEAVLSRLS